MAKFSFPKLTSDEEARNESEVAAEMDAEFRAEYCARREAACTPHENLRRFRKGRRMTQDQMAKAVGVGRRTYQQYEDGTRSLTLPAMIKLATSLECDLNELVTGEVRSMPLNARASLANSAIEAFSMLVRAFPEEPLADLQRKAANAAAISLIDPTYEYDLQDLRTETATEFMRRDSERVDNSLRLTFVRFVLSVLVN